ncbi:hypothetical protein EG339_21605 [Chryseobacterium bernardetii]|uniref:Uncharacterized protein n=1 Tax=Chryseobacterium bernardetii TaxID=1241978 RepID=A0A3G6TK10_9FLAO|nr:hypothetical protein EG339_21605 [Chryseobacterium bernardetii]
MPFLFYAVQPFYIFSKLLPYIKYHDMIQWSVQSIAAFGHSEKHKFFISFYPCAGRKLSKTSSCTVFLTTGEE